MPLAGRTDGFRQWAALPLRLIVGYGFIAHGYAKVMNGPDRFAASLHALGVPASHSMAWVTIICELLAGLLSLLAPGSRSSASHCRRFFSLRRLRCVSVQISVRSSFVR